MSIPAVKGVGVGIGFEAAKLPGSAVHDEIISSGERARSANLRRRTNRAGGLEGGMTTGEPLIVRVGMKPISTLMKPLATVEMTTGEAASAVAERSDVTAVPAMGVIAEAMMAFVLAQAMLEKFGGDSLGEMRRNFDGYLVGSANVEWNTESRPISVLSVKPVFNIILVGLPGAGKTSVGKAAARLLNRPFIDFDTEIEHREHASVGQIFDRKGEAYFRALEADLTRELAGSNGTVMATGGGWVTNPDSVALLHSTGRMIYLRAAPETVLARMAGGRCRGGRFSRARTLWGPSGPSMRPGRNCTKLRIWCWTRKLLKSQKLSSGCGVMLYR